MQDKNEKIRQRLRAKLNNKKSNSKGETAQANTNSISNSNGRGEKFKKVSSSAKSQIPLNVQFVEVDASNPNQFDLIQFLTSITQPETLGDKLHKLIRETLFILKKDLSKSVNLLIQEIKNFIVLEKSKLVDTEPLLFSEQDFQISLQELFRQLLTKISEANHGKDANPASSISLSLWLIELVDHIEKECRIQVNGSIKTPIEFLQQNNIRVTDCWLSAAYNCALLNDFKELQSNFETYLEKFNRYYTDKNILNMTPKAIELFDTIFNIILMILSEINGAQKFVQLVPFSELIIKWLDATYLQKETQQVKLMDFFCERVPLASDLWLAVSKGCLFANQLDKAEDYLSVYKSKMKDTKYEMFVYYSGMAFLAGKRGEWHKIKAYLAKAESLLANVFESNTPAGHFLTCAYKELFTAAKNQSDYSTALYYAKGITRLYKEMSWQFEKLLNDVRKVSYTKEKIQQFINLHKKKVDQWQSVVKTVKQELFKEKNFHFQQIISNGLIEIESRNIKNFSLSIKINSINLSDFEKYLTKNYISYDCQDDVLTINHFYNFDNDKFSKFFKTYKPESDDVFQTANEELTVSVSKPPSNKTINFDKEHTYIKDSKDSNVFKLRGDTVHRQYVCISPNLIAAIKKTKGINVSRIMKGLFSACDRGLVVNNSQGRKTFVLTEKDCKLKDASKKIRFFGTFVKKVKDEKQKEHTLYELDIFDPDHKLDFEKAKAIRNANKK